MLNKYLSIILLFVIPLGLLDTVHAQDIPVFKQHVLDATSTLTEAQIETLNKILVKLEEDKGSQFIVGIVETTQPFGIDEFALKVAQGARAGRKDVDDGLLLLVAKKDRKLRIEVGYGLEAIIPDARAKQIISYVILPEFKKDQMYAGILAGVVELDRIIRAGELPIQKKESKPEYNPVREISIMDRIHFYPNAMIYSFVHWSFWLEFTLAIGIGLYFSFKSPHKGALVSAGLYGLKQLVFIFIYGFVNLAMFPGFTILMYFIALFLHKLLKTQGTSGYSSSSGSSSSYKPSSSKKWYSSSSSSGSSYRSKPSSSYRSSSSSSSRSSSSSSSRSYSGGGGSFGGGGASGSW